MNTVSIGIQNLCAPCGCACRYCLLSSDKRAQAGVDYFRGRKIAEKLINWARETGFSPLPYYYIGYCAEYPQLFDTIAFSRETGFVGAEFLQCNGIAIRSRAETEDFCRRLKDAGVKHIDTTFFGTEAYHDRFAARDGDFRFMLQLAECAAQTGLICGPSLPLTRENLPMLEELCRILGGVADLDNLTAFLPDYRGRGYLLEDVRLREGDLALLPEAVSRKLNMRRYKTERDWIAGGLPAQTKRALVVTLRKDNIDAFERMSAAEIVAHVEALDDAYHAAMPEISVLAGMYGRPGCDRLYQARDLYWMWQRRFLSENKIDVYDVTDERNCAAIRS